MDQEPHERVITVRRRLPLTRKACPVCEQAFSGPSWRRYDRPACAKRADYARHAEQRRAGRRAQYARARRTRLAD